MTTAGSARTDGHVGSRYLYGCLVVILGGFILSLGVFTIRSATQSDAWQYLLWRALGFTTALLLIASVRDHRNPVLQIAHLRGFGVMAAMAMALSQISFISGVKVTTFAEVFFLVSLAPLLAAMLARPLLGERIGRLVLVAIAIAIGGVYTMTGGDFRSGNWEGRTLAIVSAVTFALYTLATRGSFASERDATLLLIGLVTTSASLVAVLANGLPVVASPFDAAVAFAHGAVFLSLGLFCFGQGSRFVPGVTFTMLAQVEAVLSPIWGYLYFNEHPTAGTVIGGMMILAAVVLQAAAGERGSARPA